MVIFKKGDSFDIGKSDKKVFLENLKKVGYDVKLNKEDRESVKVLMKYYGQGEGKKAQVRYKEMITRIKLIMESEKVFKGIMG